MYLHIGNGVSIKTDDIIGIFDLDTATVSQSTKKYISKVLSRITFLGALFICIIAALPAVFTAATGLSSNIQLGGTSILIAVGVVLETYKQLESSVASRNYSNRR